MNYKTLIKTKDQFRLYKKRIDVNAHFNHEHEGTPDRYPCLVDTVIDDDLKCCHIFIYGANFICPSCKSKNVVWPEGVVPLDLF